MKSNHQLESVSPGNWRGAVRVAFVLALLLAAVPVLAQSRVVREGRSWVEQSNGVLTPAGHVLRVTTDVGNVRVKGGSPELRWVATKRCYASSEQEARKQFERFRITAARRNEVATLDGTRTGGDMARFTVEIVVEVPRNMQLINVASDGGNVAVSNTNGRVEVATGGGTVNLDDINGSVRARTAGGNIQIGTVNAEVSIKSGGGNINIANAKRVDVSTLGGNIAVGNVAGGLIQTGAGSIGVNHSEGELKLSTAGGSIDVGDVTGALRIETGGGNIHVGGAKGHVVAITGGGNVELFKLAKGAQAQSGAGSITAEFIAGRGAFTDSGLRTTAGDVVVYLANVPCTIHAASEIASGRGIRTDFPELKITSEGGDFGPKTMYLDGALNGGGPVLKVRTSIGQIEFRRSK